MVAVPWNKLYKASYIKNNNIRFPNVKWDDLHFNLEILKNINRVYISSNAGYHFFRSRQGSETTLVFDGFLYSKRKEQFEHILSVYDYWKVQDSVIMGVVFGYYASRLIQCIQEIAISPAKDKKQKIKIILADELSKRAFRSAKYESGLLRIASIPARLGNATMCILVGKSMGFVKRHMSSTFNKLKSHSVNKAVEAKAN